MIRGSVRRIPCASHLFRPSRAAPAHPLLTAAARQLSAAPDSVHAAPSARELEAAATGQGEPRVAQVLEDYVLGWVAGTIPRYQKRPHPEGKLHGLSRWCRTLRHDIMKDLSRPPLTVSASTEDAANERPKQKVGNSRFRAATYKRYQWEMHWRVQQQQKGLVRKKWAKAMAEEALLAFLSRLEAEVRCPLHSPGPRSRRCPNPAGGACAW